MTVDLKKMVPTKLLWVDLEMTGLRPETDVILEVAAVVTDFEFTELARFEAGVSHPVELLETLLAENSWYGEHPENKAHFLAQAGQGKPSVEVDADFASFIREQFGDEPAILAGNSIHNDRNFIRHWWPNVEAALHYRMLDVSSWKVYMQGARALEYQKSESHRAADDIAESIAELRYYLEWFKGPHGA